MFRRAVPGMFFLGWMTMVKAEVPVSPLPGVTVLPGPVNGVVLGQGSPGVAVYRVPTNDEKGFSGSLLLTHGRRDVVPPVIPQGAKVVAPWAEKEFLAEPEQFWEGFVSSRFHDYAQQSTKVMAEAVAVERWVRGGEVMTLGGLRFRVLETPGFTRGAVSYVVRINDRKIAFTGDLIYGDGKLLDLYSYQDKIPGAQIRGYHGYGSRLADLLKSVRRLQEEDLDLIVPARGPLIENPDEAFARLTQRVQALYRNYLSTSALHWYFKEKRMRLCGERILGRGAEIELMPYCHYEETPSWIFTKGTSRLLISKDKMGFLLDCGNPQVIEAVQALVDAGTITRVEGIFVTHFHDDHVDSVQEAAEHFSCPVYALNEYKDVLENPSAYRLPAMTANPIRAVKGMRDGERMKWRELEFTFQFYPGQAYYHGALFVKKPEEKLLCFIGDSFSPSGIDDYCVLNRNLLHEDTGYHLCLKKLRDLEEDYWIVNEHIPHVFRFSDEEMDYLERRYRKRTEILRELAPWDDPNYMVDEQWSVFYPYGSTLEPGSRQTVSLRLTNHSPVNRTFKVALRGSHGMVVEPQKATLSLKSREEGAIDITVEAPDEAGQYLITADVESPGMAFLRWTEAMITVE